MSYLGPFNKEFRELLTVRNFVGGCTKLGIPCTPDLRIAAFLVEDAEVGQWTLQVWHQLYSFIQGLLLAQTLPFSNRMPCTSPSACFISSRCKKKK